MTRKKGRHGQRPSQKNTRTTSFGITFCIMMATWLIFSGKFDLLHLSLGVLSCAIISFASCDLLITGTSFKGMPRLWLRFLMYTPWLMKEIVMANIHVMKLVFTPNVEEKINPKLISFKSPMKDHMAMVTFANSITLTPGTITVSLSTYGDYVVHAIDDASAEPLPGDMQRRVADVFGEPHE